MRIIKIVVLSFALVNVLSGCGNKAATPQHQEDNSIILDKIHDNMIRVEGGTFSMGEEFQNGDGADFGVSFLNHRIIDLGIQAHTVSLSPFYIGKYEVTQEEWNEIMDNNPSQFKGDNLPVDNVSWNDCQEFIKRLNARTGKEYRLPTEAEWEYVAQSGEKNYGDNSCWYNENSRGTTHPVGTKSSNILGVYDIMGNVSEWCQDWYDKDYYLRSPQSNPTGAVTGTERVYRGMSFDCGFSLGSSYDVRYHNAPNYSHPTLGFRLVIDSK